MVRSLAGRWRLRRSGSDAGFLLPLSIGTAMVLVLGSLSLQLAVLQGRQLLAARRERQQASDVLHSAAHRLAGALQGPYRCLLPLPSSQWQSALLPVSCPIGLDPAALLRSELNGRVVDLRSWQPSAEGGLLRLELQGSRRRAGFLVRIGAGLGLQEVG
jgi:hypothetical protein